MASQLTDRQLLLLDNLIYLKWEDMDKKAGESIKISHIINYFKSKNKKFWQENSKEEMVTSPKTGLILISKQLFLYI